MSKPAFTPGPWTADIRIGCTAVYQGEIKSGCIQNERKRLAFFNGYKNEKGEWEILEEDKADAILIAAAPELLASLSFLVQAARTEPGMNIYKAHIEQAENVIRKAMEGETGRNNAKTA